MAFGHYPQKLKRKMTEGHPPRHVQSPGLEIGQSLWQSCIDQLAQELPEQQFNTWIRPLAAQIPEDFSKVTIFGANRFKLDWVRAQYSSRIAVLLEKLYGQPMHVELAITPREPIVRKQTISAITEMFVVEESVDVAEERNS